MPDGMRLPYRDWLPKGKPVAVVLALHGMNDSRDAWEYPGARLRRRRNRGLSRRISAASARRRDARPVAGHGQALVDDAPGHGPAAAATLSGYADCI